MPRMAPSANVDGPAGADTTSATRGLRLPLELKIKIETKDTHLGCLFFIRDRKTESNLGASAPARRKGATDGTVSERRRPGGSRHDVCDQRASSPVGAKNKNRGKRHSFGCFFFIRDRKTESNREASAPARRKGATDGTVSEQRRPGGSRHDVCD